MTTQDFKPRRKPVTYGKRSSNKPLPMFNFLDPDLDTEPIETSKCLDDPPLQPHWHSPQKRSHNAHATRTSTEDACSGETNLTLPSSSMQDKSDSVQNGSTNSSVFDFVSSDEDRDRSLEVQPTTKRRKLTPVRQGTKQVQGLGRKAVSVSKFHSGRNQDTATAQSTGSASVSSGSEQSPINSMPQSVSAAASKPRKRPQAVRKGAPAKMAMDLIDSEEEVHIVSMTSSPTPPRTPVRTSPRIQRGESNSPSAQLIEQLNRTISSENRLTKHTGRTAGQIHDKNEMPSPSQLAMRSLRLTPEEVVSPSSEQRQQEVIQQPRPLTPSRSRRRLIDDLDSTLKSSTVERTRTGSFSSSSESSVTVENGFGDSAPQDVLETNNRQIGAKDEPSLKPVPALSVTGQKITYAKQRSHLSDMVLQDMSDLAALSDAHLIEPVANGKNSVNSNFGSQNPQEELKDEEDATGCAIRSIHELRKGGETSRFQGNLDSIFEDLEAAGRTGRSRRLRGLMILTQKFLEPTFCQRFVEHGMHQRLANHALNQTDVLSLVLASCALSILLCSSKPSLKTLQHLFDAVVHSSAPLLQERKDLSKFVKAIAKDRKQNLSGAICKDLLQFQQTVLTSSMWNAYKPNDLTLQLIGLRSIENIVRGIREMKDFETLLPPQLFTQLVGILEVIAHNANIELTTSEAILTLESAISALEFSALSHGLLEDGYNEAAGRLYVLGPLLTRAEVLGKEQRDKMEQLVLRLIISVTNNNDVLCESLGQTALVPAVTTVVKKNFFELAEYADSGKALDEAKLGSVILALGSLINFAECSHSSKRSMNLKDNSGESTVDWLVTAFNRRAGKASEALSLEQTHALVTFGYLSMLICTLCLDDEIRNTVRGRMKSKSLHPLTVAVEDFLNQFRTLEQQVNVEDANNFTDRFGGILNALKEAEVMG